MRAEKGPVQRPLGRGLLASKATNMLNFPTHCAMCGGKWFFNHECQPRQNAGMPQTNKEKQEAFRARQAMLGHTEVRGIFAPPEIHAAIKEAARKLVEKHKPEEKK
jgi:hypothetical protein